MVEAFYVLASQFGRGLLSEPILDLSTIFGINMIMLINVRILKSSVDSKTFY